MQTLKLLLFFFHYQKVTLGTCLFCFIAALPMVCNGGIYLFTLFDWHTASWAILLIGFAEVSSLLNNNNENDFIINNIKYAWCIRLFL